MGSIQRRLPAQSHGLIPLMLTVQVPIVCRVQGWAAGIGFHLALAADFTVADEEARFWEPFTERGFTADSGATWRNVSTPHADQHGMWINPDNPNLIIQSNDGGANVSTDGGATWSSQLNQSTSELYGVEVDNQFPYRLYAAQQDNNTWIVMSKLPGSARLDQRDTYMAGPGCETGPIKPKPDNHNNHEA